MVPGASRPSSRLPLVSPWPVPSGTEALLSDLPGPRASRAPAVTTDDGVARKLPEGPRPGAQRRPCSGGPWRSAWRGRDGTWGADCREAARGRARGRQSQPCPRTRPRAARLKKVPYQLEDFGKRALGVMPLEALVTRFVVGSSAPVTESWLLALGSLQERMAALSLSMRPGQHRPFPSAFREASAAFRLGEIWGLLPF